MDKRVSQKKLAGEELTGLSLILFEFLPSFQRMATTF
jgi:hypothetical protein